MEEELLTADELAVRLKLPRKSIRNLAQRKIIPEVWISHRIRRFRLQEVMKFLAKRKPEGS